MPAPNILWIVTTQWRAQACGFMGDPNARTPCLDELARAGMFFPQAVTPHPFGPFARAAILTGRVSPENGVRDYYDPLPNEARTVAHRYRELGYTTAYFGKWHLGKKSREASLVGLEHAKTIVPEAARGGFDFWEGFEGGLQLNDPWLHGTRLSAPTQFGGYQADVVCERAAGWLRELNLEGQPWFCSVNLETPHPPYDAPAAGVERRDPAGIELSPSIPRGGDAEKKARTELAGYYAHIEATDRAIGRFVREVAEPNTLVVITSVHGDMHGAHGLFRKGWPHEESVRVPLIVSGAGGEKRGAQSDLVSLLDLGQLSLEWAGVERATPPPTLQRISMPSVVELPWQCDRPWSGVRTASRKLVLNDDGSPWLFFDLENDPGETTNLVSEPLRRDELAAWCERARANG